MNDAAVPYARAEALTFDCYGTLIDWDAGITAAIRPILAVHGVHAEDHELLERYAHHEATTEAGPYRRYREVVAGCLRGIAGDLGFEPDPGEVEAFAASVGDWPPFPDSRDALATLARRYRLGVITNCDDDLFARTNRQLDVPFEWIVTAQQVGAYKPDERNFNVALERIGPPRDRIIHVAQSLYHDHVPARRLGLTSVWINRRGEDPASVPDAAPDATYPDMATFAAAATA
jgi:2-haloacid dehalogenase